MKLTCERYPELWLPKHNVRFVDGVAEVSQQKGKAILAESPHVTAVVEPEPEPAPARRRN